VIHGHNRSIRNDVVGFLRDLGLDPIVLEDRPSEGLTIIEKFERHSRKASIAIGLLTPDDVGHPQGVPELARPRARQNVVFELGFFVGRLGRKRVIAVRDGDVEVPSDYHGVVYITWDAQMTWRIKMIQELETAGLPVTKAYETLLRTKG